MNQDCPVCGAELDVEQFDERGEWREIYYFCEQCKNDFVYKIVYGTQSNKVVNEYWMNTDEEIAAMQDNYERRLGAYDQDH